MLSGDMSTLRSSRTPSCKNMGTALASTFKTRHSVKTPLINRAVPTRSLTTNASRLPKMPKRYSARTGTLLIPPTTSIPLTTLCWFVAEPAADLVRGRTMTRRPRPRTLLTLCILSGNELLTVLRCPTTAPKARTAFMS